MKVNEIFKSIQGETSLAGYSSVFVRLTGCNLRCGYCDTTDSYDKGENLSDEDIIAKIDALAPFHHITLTGGEPLLQKETPALVEKLIHRRRRVRIETNGSIDISCVPPPAERIVDIKTPSSGEEGSFCMNNILHLAGWDEVKFVIADDNDFFYAKDFCEKNFSGSRPIINISPVSGKISPDRCAKLMLEHKLDARLSLQLHKIIWPKGEPK